MAAVNVKNSKLQPKRHFSDEMIIYTTYASEHIEITCMFKSTKNTLQLSLDYSIAKLHQKCQNGIQHDKYFSKTYDNGNSVVFLPHTFIIPYCLCFVFD